MTAERIAKQPSPDKTAVEWMDGLAEAVDATTLHPGWFPVLARVPLFQTLSDPAPQAHRPPGGAEALQARAPRSCARADAATPSTSSWTAPPSSRRRPATSTSSRRGDHFGELALLDGAPRSATITATGSIATAKIRRNDFLALLKEEPAIGVGLAHGLVAIVRELQEAEGRKNGRVRPA